MSSVNSPKLANKEELPLLPQPPLDQQNSPKEAPTKLPKKSPSLPNHLSPQGAGGSMNILTPTAAGGASGGITNTAQKKQKAGKKKPQEATSANKTAEQVNNDKYINIPGVTEWFQAKKSELERLSGGVTATAPTASINQVTNSTHGKKNTSILGLPLSSHIWRPPRVDQERFQVETVPENQNSQPAFKVPQTIQIAKGELSNPEFQQRRFNQQDIKKKKSDGLLIRKRRSRSFDMQKPKRSISLIDENSNSDSSQSSSDIDIEGEAVKIRRKKDFGGATEEKKQAEIKVAAMPLMINKRRCTKAQEKTVYDPKYIDSPEQQEKLKEYLELVEFMMSETLSSCNGLWLKGSLTSYSEQALQLLASCDYNFDLAQFHLLYPSVVASQRRILADGSTCSRLLDSLTPRELHSIVTDAVIDLRGCKTQEAEEAVRALLTQLYSRTLGFSQEDMQYHAALLRKLRVEMPPEVEREVARSREFSKSIKKRCGGGGIAGVIGSGAQQPQMQISMDKKMKIDELIEMQNEARLNYYVITPEIITLNDYVQKAQNWIEKADLLSKQVTQLKTLQILLQDARSIPVNFDVQYETLRKRYQDGENLVQKIYNSFTKVSKTRTQLSDYKPSQQPVNSDKELQYRQILRDADALLITNPEIVRLREHIEQIDQWKSRVSLFLEDTLQSQKKHKEIFLQLIRETALFKVELDLTEDLQRRLEFVEWHDRVEVLHLLMTADQPSWIDLNKLEVVVIEGSTKGFAGVNMPEVQAVVQLYKIAEATQKEIKNAKDSLESGKETKELSELIKIIEKVEDMKVKIDEVQDLTKIIDEAQSYVQICDKYLSNWSLLTEVNKDQNNNDSEQKTKYIQELIKFRDKVRDFGIICPSFTKLNDNLQPLLVWIENTRQLIKVYHKSLELSVPFQQLNLMDGKSDQQHQIPEKDHQLLPYLLSQATDSLPILTCTKDFSYLSDLSSRVSLWLQKCDESIQLDDAAVTLEKLISEHLPVPPERQQILQKHLRRVKWLRRLQEVSAAEKVKLKTIETLAREGAQIGDSRLTAEVAMVNEQLARCKEWSEEQNKSSLESNGEIKRLLEIGQRTLKFELDDYVDLKNFYRDTCAWRKTTKKILTQGHRIPELTSEFLKKHIDEGRNQLAIDDKETTLLQTILDMATHWKSLVLKLQQSRELAKLDLFNPAALQHPTKLTDQPRFTFMVQRREALEIQPSPHPSQDPLEMRTAFALQEVITPFDLPPPKPIKQLKKQYGSEQDLQFLPVDNKRYCICRRADDGLQFMIECDSCKEWFHGHCVGIASEDEADLKEQQNYICIGCARAFYSFDFTSSGGEQKKKAPEDGGQQVITINPATLKVFSQSAQKRMPIEFIKRLIEEGLQIPIYLNELHQLRAVHYRSNQIKARAAFLLCYPIYKYKAGDQDLSDCEDDINNPYNSDSSSETIINTKISQFGPKAGDQEQERAACWGRDRIGTELLQLYLETESLPFEIDTELTDSMIKTIRVRRWYWESQSFIAQVIKNQNLSNNSKALLKKNFKKMISSYDTSSQGNNSAPYLQQYMEYQLQCLKLALDSLSTNQPLQLPEIPKPVQKIEEEDDSQEKLSSSDVEMVEQ